MQFKLENHVINQLYEFSKLYERFYLVDPESIWFKRLIDLSIKRSALAAMLPNKTEYMNINFLDYKVELQKILPAKNSNDYSLYIDTLKKIPNIFNEQSHYSLDILETIHKSLLGRPENSESYKYRNITRELTKSIIENDIPRTVRVPVHTQPNEIFPKMTEYVNWLTEYNNEIPLPLLAGLAHIKLAEIHPYSDGNGRLAMIMDNGILYKHGLELYPLISLEEYFLQNFEQYYFLIEKSINTKDNSEWLEFYTKGLLDSVNTSMHLLYKISGGTIDLSSRHIIKLTEKETEVLDIVIHSTQASGAEIAHKLNVSRQTINVILNHLNQKGLVEKIGSGTSTRFKAITI